MNIKEFSDEFDTMLNSFGLQPNITLDEYEKSVFLTKAQEQIIIDTYAGNNPKGMSFEETEEARRYLSNLVETYETSAQIEGKTGISKDSIFFQIPGDVWFITYEAAVLNDTRLGCLNLIEASVIPIPQDDYYRIRNNPFRGPSKDRVLRLDIKGNLMELVSKYDVQKYIVRYLAQPSPIILIPLPDNLSINGISTVSECELNPVIHRAILERAVTLAIISKTQLTGSKE